MFRVPHFDVYESNPVFEFELSRVKRLATPNRLWMYSALVQTIPSLLLLALYMLALQDYVSHYYLNNPSSGYYYYTSFDSKMGALGIFLLVVSGILFLCGDIYYISVSVHSINNQINSGHWELLRLTPMEDIDILEAKLATAHIRAWRVMHLEIALRLLLLVLFWSLLILPARAFTNNNSLFGQYSIWWSFGNSLQSRPFYTLFTVATSFIFMVAFVLEPRWRMRSLTSLGLYISARIHNISMSSLAAFFSLIGFHFVQLVSMIILGWVLLRLFFDYGNYTRYSYDFYLILQLISYTILLVLIFLFYRLSDRWARRAALRFAFRPDR